MRHKMLKRCLLVTPIIVLLGTLYFLNYTVEYFRNTAYTVVYNTNMESVQQFSLELTAFSELGYPSSEWGELYTNVIYNYNATLGEKDAIVTFLLDESKQPHHSTEENEAFLDVVFESEENIAAIDDAFETKSNGEIQLRYGDTPETFYYHRFYSGPDDFTLFMCVEKAEIASQINTNGVVIPICIVGFLLLFTMEYGVFHLIQDGLLADKDDADKREAV